MAIEADITLWTEIATLIVETAIVVLLVKTVRDYAEVAKVSKLQTEQRFRPWVGPTSGIDHVRTDAGKHQFAIAVKNFGEIPATNVTAESLVQSTLPSRNIMQDRNVSIEKFILGPLLPNMEKKYWLFLESKDVENAKNESSQLFTFVHFTYEYKGGKSGYGMISQFDPKISLFVHKDMWVD
jgi:hypothetical protein